MSNFDDAAIAVYKGPGDMNSRAVNFIAGIDSRSDPLPAEWGTGRFWIHVTPISQGVYVCMCAAEATATVPIATDAGAQAVALGEFCPANAATPMVVPEGYLYFTRIAPGGTTDVMVTLRSDKGSY